MQSHGPRPDLDLLRGVLPEGCGVLLYVRAAAAPWEIRGVVGDAPGVVGVPLQTLHEVWSELIHPEDEPVLLATLSTLGPGGGASLDYRVRGALGGERWVRDRCQRLPGPDSRAAIMGVLFDVSVERTLRGQISALEERIWRAQRMDSLGGLAVGIAHDLGNLLTAIVSAAQLVEAHDGLPQAVTEDLAVIRESGRRGSDFVRQILRFAAREEHHAGPVDLNVVVEDLRVIVGRSLGTDIRLHVHTNPELPAVHCDPVQVEQVLLNLAVNAREAMPGGGTLTISTGFARLDSAIPAQGVTLSPGEYAVLTVADTGRGIPRQVQRRIFEPFFSTKVRTGSGSGFGLSTVQRIVRGHRGGVQIESAEGAGTTFRIYLPVGQAWALPGPEMAGRVGEGPSPGWILLVEPDPAVREVMKRVLARERFGVLAVEDARHAVRLFDRVRRPFDLVVASIVLPDRSGPELVQLLRKRAEHLPVVYLSDYAGHAEHSDLELTQTAYVEKPFTPTQLLEAIEAVLPPPPRFRAREADG